MIFCFPFLKNKKFSGVKKMSVFEIEFSLSTKRYRVSAKNLEQAIAEAEAVLRYDLQNVCPDCSVREVR